jgi:hypothetical protein
VDRARSAIPLSLLTFALSALQLYKPVPFWENMENVQGLVPETYHKMVALLAVV